MNVKCGRGTGGRSACLGQRLAGLLCGLSGATDTVPGMTLDLLDILPASWRTELGPHLDPATVANLAAFVDAEYQTQTIYPPRSDLFAAYRLCDPRRARVLILGQDPYHKAGQAHGLSFSVRDGVTVPPSLRNVFCELRDDLGVVPLRSGDLTRWATQGVLLLNAVLTVREGRPASHAGKGWEHVTDATIRALNAMDHRVVFVLWGSYARKKASLVTAGHHTVIEAGHPSPMNPAGFRGSRPFSKINAALAEVGLDPIDWI
jgi:uracil-DNA glycosylase